MPESASSFMVGNSPYPASYAAPLVNFDKLAQLPDTYFKGTQDARTLALQNAFPGGLPKDKNTGELDLDAITDKLSKVGGAQYAQGLMPYLIDSQVARGALRAGQASNPDADETTAPPVRPMGSAGGPSGPGNITGPRRNAPPAGGPMSSAAPAAPAAQPALSSVGTDNNGADTVRSIVTEHAGGRDVPRQMLTNVAAAFKVQSPDAPLDPGQAQMIRARLATGITPTAAGQPSPVTGGGAPITPAGGTGGNGAPAPGPSTETAMPSTGIRPTIPAPQVAQAAPDDNGPALAPAPLVNAQPATVPGVPRGVDPGAYAARLQQKARGLETQADALATYKPAVADSLRAQAKPLEDQATAILEFQRKIALPTDEQKGLNSGATAAKAAIEANVKSSTTQMAGIRGSASTYEGENGLQPKVQLAQSILNDPRIYTGAGGDWSKMLNRAVAIYGPTAPAQLQEMLEKVTAGAALAQVSGLKTAMMEAGGASSSSARIFQLQAELINKASPQLGTTLPGNRALVELERRAGEQSLAVRNLALDYLGPTDANGVTTKHKYLDAGFDKVLSKFLESHPLFTKEEMTQPTLLGAPTAPPSLKTPQDVSTWAQAMGLKEGDAVRRGNGYIYYHGPAAAQPGTAHAAPAPQRQMPAPQSAPAAPAPAPRPQRPAPPEMPL